MNSLSITISGLNSARSVKRTLTNIGSDFGSVYKLTIDSLLELDVKVSPNELTFSGTSDKILFSVLFKASASWHWNFGATDQLKI